MEQGTSCQTALAKNNGSKIHHWKSHLLFSGIIVLVLFGACSENSLPEFDWIKIKKGLCDFGDENGNIEESPSISASINAFEISSTTVTNRQFQQFTAATHYITEGEKNGSIYYDGSIWKIDLQRNWRHPQGGNSDYKQLLNHPVVCITYTDAKAYCDWAKVRLPSEIEWEYVCEKGKTNSTEINIDQLDNNVLNTHDHFENTSPVKSFPQNQLGIYEMLGNVWEICEDNYYTDIHDILLLRKSIITQQAYLGPTSIIDKNNSSINYKVIKGGSFLCFKNYCHGYRSDARQSVPINESYFHVGFRVVRDIQ